MLKQIRSHKKSKISNKHSVHDNALYTLRNQSKLLKDFKYKLTIGEKTHLYWLCNMSLKAYTDIKEDTFIGYMLLLGNANNCGNMS